MAFCGIGRIALSVGLALALAGCQNGGEFPLFKKKDAAQAQGRDTATRLVERDVEAPDVFQATEDGLWDGRPSLGGVWVAYPGVTDPERVIIRNEKNGKFVIGALFRRERENPGPKLQVSSDAASALDLLAGQPTLLNVTALRKEEVPVDPPAPEVEADTIGAPETIEATPLEPIAAAAAAIDKAEGKANTPPAPRPTGGVITPAATPAPAAAPAAPAKTSPLAKPYIQIGIFSVEANANRTGDALRNAGVVPSILQGESSGKSFWRVVVGPFDTSGDRAALLKKVKGLGYTDAYFVTN